MRVPFFPLVLFLATLWAVSNPIQARTNSQAIIDCDKMRDDPVVCTACNIYHEARGQTMQPDGASPGMLAVALVTLNRVNSLLYPNNFCAAVWQKQLWRIGPRKNCWKEKRCGWSAQFSWTKDGKPDLVHNMDAWILSLTYAGLVVNAHTTGQPINDITFGAMWYHRWDQGELIRSAKRDDSHPLRWYRWDMPFHGPKWYADYYPTVRIGDHQFFAKDEGKFLEVMTGMMPTWDVVQAEEAPEDAAATLDTESDPEVTIHTVPSE